jgi:hypothetical protein
MAQSQLQFSHANGTVKPHSVKSLEAPKEPAAKNATATKPAAKAPARKKK